MIRDNHAALQADLERESLSVFWYERVSGIPSTFGRLLYLSSLRDFNNGRYTEPRLAARYGEEEAERVIRLSHVIAFRQWLEYGLEEQKADLDLYLSALRDNKRTVLEVWLRLEPYRALMPESAEEGEQQLFLCDLEAILALLRKQFRAA